MLSSILDSARTEDDRPVGGRLGRLLGRDRRVRIAGGVIGTIALLALLAPVIAPYAPYETIDIVGLKNRPPSLAHPFGTDLYGRDLLSGVLYGARISLAVAATAVLLAGTIGTLYGLIAGFAGGIVDTVMMRLLDAFLAIPRVLLIIGVVAILPSREVAPLVLVIGATGWFGMSRLVRAEVRSALHHEYVAAARALGARPWRIAARHLLPNVIGPVIVSMALGVANVIALEAALSYIGLGLASPNFSWGTMLREGTDVLGGAWHVAVIPGAAIVATVLAFNVLGDALRDALAARQLDEPMA